MSNNQNDNINEAIMGGYIKIIKDAYEFTIAQDGLTYLPYTGNGDEKDKDMFLSWNELRKIFIEERDK